MSRFNGNKASLRASVKTENLAGGEAYAESAELEFASILLTSMLKDQFYRSADETVNKIKELLGKVDPKFAAKVAIYARNEFGMRSVTQLVAGELAKRVKGQSWTKDFFNKVIHRADDVLEILAYYTAVYGKRPIPNSLKKGLGSKLSSFTEYQLAKYAGNRSDIGMVDAVNLLHPKSTKALKKLMTGKLKAAETWENTMTKIGSESETDEEATEARAEGWNSLLKSKKLGYFALLRNCIKICVECPDLVDEVYTQLTDHEVIKKSLVFPFRFLTAYKMVQSESNLTTVAKKTLLKALNEATDLSLENVPKFKGSTLVVLDSSGSMGQAVCGKNSVAEVGALFSAVLYKSQLDCDFMTFSDAATYQTLDSGNSTLSLVTNMSFIYGGTNFHSIFQKANRKYDRIFILSDMQGWVGHHTPAAEFKSYCAKYSANPKVYSFDLAGFGTLQFPEKNVTAIAGFSDKTFDLLHRLEKDKGALLKEIKAIEL